jgi:hypothetical protein
MLTSLHLGVWSGMLHDKTVTDEVSENHNAQKDAGRYNKRIVANTFLRHVSGKASSARKIHRILTLPWDDNGCRILSTVMHQQYSEQMRLQRHGFEAAVLDFTNPDNIKAYQQEARVRLGSMFNADDYPTEDAIRNKFSFDVETTAVPEAGDFRAELSNASVKAIVKDIEQRSEARIQTAMNDVFGRIANLTEHMVERLRSYTEKTKDDEPSNKFRDSLVYNLQELADLLPGLNITGDKRITELEDEVRYWKGQFYAARNRMLNLFDTPPEKWEGLA